MHNKQKGLLPQVVIVELVWRMYNQLPSEERAILDLLERKPYFLLQLPDNSFFSLEPQDQAKLTVYKWNAKEKKWKVWCPHAIPIRFETLSKRQKAELRARIRGGYTGFASIHMLHFVLRYFVQHKLVKIVKYPEPTKDGLIRYRVMVKDKTRFGTYRTVLRNKTQMLEVIVEGAHPHHHEVVKRKKKLKRATGNTMSVEQPTVMVAVAEVASTEDRLARLEELDGQKSTSTRSLDVDLEDSSSHGEDRSGPDF